LPEKCGCLKNELENPASTKNLQDARLSLTICMKKGINEKPADLQRAFWQYLTI
jgi:hypothetical protein